MSIEPAAVPAKSSDVAPTLPLPRPHGPPLIGADPHLRAVVARARLVAPTRMPVLVTGESGTGKELLARMLHDHGPEPAGPFVTVNCGALARDLADSELFGHERGAFTGAAAKRGGWFEEAHGGTLVLDEIGDLPLELQPKLLRTLETGRVRRVGGSGETAVRVRVVAMTLKDLRREVDRGTFRLDLYHRLAGFELGLPALRRRAGDIPLLVQHFLDELAPELGPRAVDPAALARLAAHDWPGNVRELRNVVRRAAILSLDRIDAAALELGGAAAAVCDLRLVTGAPDHPFTLRDRRALEAAADNLALPGKTFVQLEREIFLWALRRTGGSRRRAAQLLGLSRSTFCDRVKRMGLITDGASAPAPSNEAVA
jgi:two-component system, NtrC family, nitrogen regulation response regulator GlnG